jgi:hypothetical protein
MQEDMQVQEFGIPQTRQTGIKKKIIAALLLAIALVGGYVVMKKNSPNILAKNVLSGAADTSKNLSTEEQEKQIADVVAAVGKLMLLPANDEPVLARVEDPEALVKQQAFFTGSEKGDTLLVFPKAQRAVLYSPKRNLIINSGPIIAGEQGAAAPQTATPAPESEVVSPQAQTPSSTIPPKKK